MTTHEITHDHWSIMFAIFVFVTFMIIVAEALTAREGIIVPPRRGMSEQQIKTIVFAVLSGVLLAGATGLVVNRYDMSKTEKVPHRTIVAAHAHQFTYSARYVTNDQVNEVLTHDYHLKARPVGEYTDYSTLTDTTTKKTYVDCDVHVSTSPDEHTATIDHVTCAETKTFTPANTDDTDH